MDQEGRQLGGKIRLAINQSIVKMYRKTHKQRKWVGSKLT